MAIPFSVITFPGNVLRNDLTGQYGARFWNLSGEDVVITHLGRWVAPGNSLTHVLSIWGEYGEEWGNVTIDCAGATPGDFLWGELPVPAVVPKGYGAYIVSNETAGGDYWYNGYSSNAANNQVGTWEDIGFVQVGSRNPATGENKDGGGLTLTNGPTSFKYTSPVRSWTKSGTTYTTNGVYYQIVSAMADADEGDTVLIPAGTYTWGEGGTQMNIKAGVTLAGAGQGATIINMHPTATVAFTATLIKLNTGSVLRDMTFIGGEGTPLPRASLLSTGTASGWRVTNITFTQRFSPGVNQIGQRGYFLYGQYTPNGLIDNCTITGGDGQCELVFTRGTNDSWDTAHSMGGQENIFIEQCTFNGLGYVNDANSNARHVVRNCTINGPIKIDGHGIWTNGGPARGCRHVEAYRNTWTFTTGTWPAIEIRGGGGRIWGNTAAAVVGNNGAWFFLTEYGLFSNNGNFNGFYQTPTFYPVRDQIGRGRYATPGDWTTATSEPVYVWSNTRGGVDWSFSYKNPNAAAIAQYALETGNPAATFSHTDIIQADRDYFKQTVGTTFDGSSGVGIGTKAEMLAITPSKTGVGFWVTDEGSWDTTLPLNTSGQLYVWSGSAWVLDYVPYTYPHPQRGSLSAPAVSSSTGSQTVDAGDVVVMSVIATGNPVPTYQWRKNGDAIIGANSATLTLTYVTEDSEGSYDCVLTNSEGSATSDAATLTVNPLVDTDAPSPNPATFATIEVQSSRRIAVTATTATDTESSPVQYNFAINDVWTGWQSSPLRYFTELTPSTEYTFLCKSRDAILNEGQQSEPSTATTNAPEPTSSANVLGNRGTRARRLGIF